MATIRQGVINTHAVALLAAVLGDAGRVEDGELVVEPAALAGTEVRLVRPGVRSLVETVSADVAGPLVVRHAEFDRVVVVRGDGVRLESRTVWAGSRASSLCEVELWDADEALVDMVRGCADVGETIAKVRAVEPGSWPLTLDEIARARRGR